MHKLDKGVPIPTSKSGRFPFFTMAVGESFALPNITPEDRREIACASASAQNTQRLSAKKFAHAAATAFHEAAEREKLRFPAGEHDDTVDSEAWLAQLVLGKEPRSPPKTKGNSLCFN